MIRSIVSPTRSSRRFRGYGATARSCPHRAGMSPARRGVRGVAVRTAAADVRAAVVVRRRELLDRKIPDRSRHVVVPDLGGKRAAEDLSDALDVEQRDLTLRITDPDAGDKLGHVTAEPGVLEVLGGPGLARHRTGAERGRRSGAARNDAPQGAGDLSGHVRGEDTPTRRFQRDLLPLRPAYTLERLRGVMDGAGGEGRVVVGQLERREPDRAERDRAG